MNLPFSFELKVGYLDTITYWKIKYYDDNTYDETTDYDIDNNTFDPNNPKDAHGNSITNTGRLIIPSVNFDYRADIEYNSPFIAGNACGFHNYNGSNRVGGWYQYNYSSGKVLKVYKPVNCESITIYGIYNNPSGEKETTFITYNFSRENTLNLMVISFAENSESICAEGNRHIDHSIYYKNNEFYIRTHLYQINGSNFCVSEKEYIDSNRSFINSLQSRSLSEYHNFALSRTFQKFFIGGYEL